MALGVTPLRVGQEAYWLDQIARDACEYYSGKGESPGWWLGSLAERASLQGEASEEAVHRLFAGQDPTTGEQRVAPVWRVDPRSKLPAGPLQAALGELAAARRVDVGGLAAGERDRQELQRVLSARGRLNVAVVERVCRAILERNPEELYGDAYAEARKHAGRRIDARVASFDLSLSDPKSVSLLAAGSSAEVRAEVNRARHAAIQQVLAWVEQEAVGVRRGHNGIEPFRGQGVTAAAFDHRTSREGDPQWHTHVLVQNATLGPDGRWSALDSRRLYAHAMTADRIYHAALRAELTRRLDVRWRQVDPRSGAAEIDGLHDPKLLRAFSKRRAQVLAQQREWGHQGIAAGKAAALATRKAKDNSESEESFYSRVVRGLAEHGVGRAELAQVCRGGRAQSRELSPATRARLLDELAGPGGLTAQASTFARRDVLDALAKQLPVAASAERTLAQLEELADEFLASERAVPVTVDRGLEERRYSTPELLALERGLVEQAQHRSEGAGVVAGEHVRATLQARPGLDADQQAMVRQVTQDGAGISLVVGYAGAGKTYATGAAVEAFHRGGYQVICTAPTGAAARELERETKLPAPTLDSLLGQLDRRDEHLDRHTVVVLDEAAMVGTRKLARLLGYAERAGSKVVMIGDDRQLAAIDTGGAFRAFRLRLGATELRGNHRQQTALGQEVAALFRAGRQEEALDRLVAHGKVVVCRTEQEANAAQVSDWWQRFRQGQQAGMIAFTRAETIRLNSAARQLMGEAGRLGPDTLQVGEREFRVGDQVVCGRNARRRLGVVNGTRGEITALDATRRTLTIRTDEGREVSLPGWYVAGQGFERPWVDHGYAITGHKTQGLSGDDFGVRPSTRADAHWAYVAASRHRFDLRLYLVEEFTAPDHDDTRHARDPLEDRVAATLRAMQRPGEQVFAIDQDLVAEVLALGVSELRRERDRLAELLAGAPPSVGQRIALAEERHRHAEQRLAQAEQAAQATGSGWGGRAWRMLRPTPWPARGEATVAAAEAARAADQAAGELVDLRRRQQQRVAFLERHQPAAVRYTAIVRELGWHGRATARALELERPSWMTELLGEVPDSSRGRRAWRHTAARLQHYRDAYPSGDPERPLGPEPTRDLAQRRAWRACRQAIDHYQRQHRSRDQRQHLRDRDWTRARDRDRRRERDAG